MTLSNTSQYAIRILAYMVNKEESQLVTATELADILMISYKFLTKIMTDLVKADFVISVRGRDGGYKLKKDPAEVTVNDILELFNDSIKDEQCILGIGFCNGLCKCALHDQWMEPKLLMQKMFRESSLKEISHQGCKV